MQQKFLFNFLIFAITYEDITSTLVVTPANNAISQDSAVTLQCTSDVSNSFIQWYNSLCVTTMDIAQCTSDLIYTGYGLASDVPARFGVTEDSNATHVTRDLNINPTQLTDAGVYLCAEQIPGVAGVRDSSSAQLIVLDGETRCTSNVSASEAVEVNDVIVMTCSVTYSGNWAPVMRWFNSNKNFTDDNVTSTATTVTSQLTVAASADLRGSKIVCVTYFSQPSTPLTTDAANVPSYTDTWPSPTINIKTEESSSFDLLYIILIVIGVLILLGLLIACLACCYYLMRRNNRKKSTTGSRPRPQSRPQPRPRPLPRQTVVPYRADRVRGRNTRNDCSDAGSVHSAAVWTAREDPAPHQHQRGVDGYPHHAQQPGHGSHYYPSSYLG